MKYKNAGHVYRIPIFEEPGPHWICSSDDPIVVEHWLNLSLRNAWKTQDVFLEEEDERVTIVRMGTGVAVA